MLGLRGPPVLHDAAERGQRRPGTSNGPTTRQIIHCHHVDRLRKQPAAVTVRIELHREGPGTSSIQISKAVDPKTRHQNRDASGTKDDRTVA